MDNAELMQELAVIQNSAQLIKDISEGSLQRNLHVTKIQAMMLNLYHVKLDRNEAKQTVDSFTRTFVALLEPANAEDITTLTKREVIKKKVQERMAVLRLVSDGHPSYYLEREVKEVCAALTRACDMTLHAVPVKRLGRPALRLAVSN